MHATTFAGAQAALLSGNRHLSTNLNLATSRQPTTNPSDRLGVAQEMSEAGLLVFGGPTGLGAIAVGDPDLRADVAEDEAFWP